MYSSTYLCNCNQELMLTSTALICIAISFASHEKFYVLSHSYTSSFTQLCMHTWVITDIIKLLDYSDLITDIIKLLDYSDLHAVLLRSYN